MVRRDPVAGKGGREKPARPPFINEGQPVNIGEISTGLSLTVIIGVLIVTVLASLLSTKGTAHNTVSAARRHATEYLDIEKDSAWREKIFGKLLAEEAQLKKLPEKYRPRIREEEKLMALTRKSLPAAEGMTGPR